MKNIHGLIGGWTLGLALAAGLCSASTSVTGGLGAAAAAIAFPQQEAENDHDVLLFRNGQKVQGKILEETPGKIKMKVIVRGISAEREYDRADILSIERAETPADAADPATPATPAKPGVKAATKPAPRPATSGDRADTRSVYVMELKGWFGTEISETPIREAVADAKRYEPDYLVVVMNNDWSLHEGLEKLGDDVDWAFDQLFRAEAIAPVFTQDIPREWDKQPQIIFWIKNAMGGAAFLPLICPDIYFSSTGKMGGVGGLDQLMGGTGDEVVRQKQYSLRLGHAEGMAIHGGYDPKLVKAMCWTPYILSVRYEGGRPVYLERMPQAGAGEYLLTDDGLEDREDTDEERVRGTGNDILTLNADTAYKLGLSKGTVDTLDDLMHALGIGRNHEIVKGRAESILQRWRDGVASYGRDLRTLGREFERIQVTGDTPRERNRKRSQQITTLERMQRIIKKYEEGIHPSQEGFPSYEDLAIMIAQIRTEIQRDR